MSDDPFFVVKREVEQSLVQVGSLYQAWFQQLTSNTVSETDLKRQGADIRDILRNIVADLDELDETIQIVQSNPARFKLDRSHIDERKQFVQESRKKVEEMKSSVNNPSAARMGGQQGMRNNLMGSNKTRTDKYGRTEDEYKVSNQKFVEREQQQQQALMQDQDAQMSDVAVTVGNLREVARVMGSELDDQTRLLGEVETQVDSTQGRLEDGMKRMKDFIKANSDSRQQWCIAILVVILVLIIVLVLSF
ncbi:hypothetical protein BATDEDRAFT_87407 [Batrachochytrium dendrobatidis JAM81]|uniref:t-SNARE affecting a late Golgi compartment protein 1 n=1 Tax=Batrachochytrium dendrobatidis (strain JAM81 / FGSC 10211) TaxID=684364 RepID=F4NZV6_BATDJ|nr:uncharacterized protein BATDEDRAFT_87407 [Batrachochytrium dendrobatidis JAM81]EGF81156.1 hypothetical protein BATDEDRAFT_87407 [Batrachochytrium dendrobatidis JAM81]|eukprot:XP_006678104.1 hypothetical protein BATDEDRAFT_87407 [Batrachochytrium dendrobatidis JAM81]